MGRSSLQGTAWHYEFLPRKKKIKKEIVTDPERIKTAIKNKTEKASIKTKTEAIDIFTLHKKYSFCLGRWFFSDKYGTGQAIRIEGRNLIIKFNNGKELPFMLPYYIEENRLIQVDAPKN